MSLRNVNVVACTCERCGKEWIPRTCPACKSPNWNKDKDARPEAPELPDELAEELASEQTPIERQSLANDVPESERTIARKMGHEIGCDCHACERMREIIKSADEKQPIGKRKEKGSSGRAPAGKTEPTQRKKAGARTRARPPHISY